MKKVFFISIFFPFLLKAGNPIKIDSTKSIDSLYLHPINWVLACKNPLINYPQYRSGNFCVNAIQNTEQYAKWGIMDSIYVALGGPRSSFSVSAPCANPVSYYPLTPSCQNQIQNSEQYAQWVILDSIFAAAQRLKSSSISGNLQPRHLPFDSTATFLGTEFNYQYNNGVESGTNFVSNETITQAAGTTTILTSSSSRYQVLQGNVTQVYTLPNAHLLHKAPYFEFNNNGSPACKLIVENFTGTVLDTIQNNCYTVFILLDSTTNTGTWDHHSLTPSNGTSGYVLTSNGSTKSATWKPAAVATTFKDSANYRSLWTTNFVNAQSIGLKQGYAYRKYNDTIFHKLEAKAEALCKCNNPVVYFPTTGNDTSQIYYDTGTYVNLVNTIYNKRMAAKIPIMNNTSATPHTLTLEGQQMSFYTSQAPLIRILDKPSSGWNCIIGGDGTFAQNFTNVSLILKHINFEMEAPVHLAGVYGSNCEHTDYDDCHIFLNIANNLPLASISYYQFGFSTATFDNNGYPNPIKNCSVGNVYFGIILGEWGVMSNCDVGTCVAGVGVENALQAQRGIGLNQFINNHINIWVTDSDFWASSQAPSAQFSMDEYNATNLTHSSSTYPYKTQYDFYDAANVNTGEINWRVLNGVAYKDTLLVQGANNTIFTDLQYPKTSAGMQYASPSGIGGAQGVQNNSTANVTYNGSYYGLVTTKPFYSSGATSAFGSTNHERFTITSWGGSGDLPSGSYISDSGTGTNLSILPNATAGAGGIYIGAWNGTKECNVLSTRRVASGFPTLYLDSCGGSINCGGQLNLVAASSSNVPLIFSSATLNGTAFAGAMEYNGSNTYLTTIAGERGVIPQTDINNDLTGLTATSGIDSITVPASNQTYMCAGYITITVAAVTDVVTFTVTYTDETNTVRTQTLENNGSQSNFTTLGSYTLQPITFRAKASTKIALRATLTNSSGSVTYDAGGWIQRVIK